MQILLIVLNQTTNKNQNYYTTTMKTETIESVRHEVRELQLWIENTGTYYERFLVPIAKNFQRKLKKNTFDMTKAPKAYYAVCLLASNDYKEQFGYSFTKLVRDLVAQNLAEEYHAEILAQNGEMFS